MGRASENSGGTVGKALAVLDEVAGFGRPVRFVEIQSNSELPKATLYRLLQTLTSQGMLSYDNDRQVYSVGIRLVRLAHAAWRHSSIAPIARQHIDALSRSVGETVHLAQLDNGHVLYLDKRNAANPIDMFSQAGKIGPGYCTGVGKAMLASLDARSLDQAMNNQAFHRFTRNTITDEAQLRTELAEIRKSGVAFDREEHEPGIICVAVPILTTDGAVVGGLSVTSSSQRHSIRDLEVHVPKLKNTAKNIGEAAQLWRFPDQKTKIPA